MAEKKVTKAANTVDVNAFVSRKLAVLNTKAGAKAEFLASRVQENKKKVGVK